MKKLKLCAAILALSAILLQPQAAVEGGQSAMRIWVNSVAPALFPFLVMMPVLTGPEACAVYKRIFSGMMRRIFRLPGEAAPAVIIGMISGAPGGAMAIRRIAAQSGMSEGDTCRIALSVAGLSPAYLVLGVGQGLYGSAKLGVQLAMIQACMQLLLLFLLRGVFDERKEAVCMAPELEGRGPVRSAVEAVLAVCGYMVLFSSVGSILSKCLGGAAGSILLAAADLPSGMAALRGWPMFVQGAALGFGGLCIAAQNLDALRGTAVKPADYLAVKGMSAAMFSCAAGMICRNGSERIYWNAGQQKTFAFSLLAALLVLLPLMFYLTNTFFLNKQKSAEEGLQMTENTNM